MSCERLTRLHGKGYNGILAAVDTRLEGDEDGILTTSICMARRYMSLLIRRRYLKFAVSATLLLVLKVLKRPSWPPALPAEATVTVAQPRGGPVLLSLLSKNGSFFDKNRFKVATQYCEEASFDLASYCA